MLSQQPAVVRVAYFLVRVSPRTTAFCHGEAQQFEKRFSEVPCNLTDYAGTNRACPALELCGRMALNRGFKQGESDVTRGLRLSWLSLFLFRYHPFKRSILSPVTWSTALFALSICPLLATGQFTLILSRPLLVSYAGNFTALTLALLIFQNYRVLFRELRYAVQSDQVIVLRLIKGTAYKAINDDRGLLCLFFIPTLGVTLVWVALTFYDFFPHDDFAFLYFLDPLWYSNLPGKFSRLLAIWIAITGSTAILCTGIWFQLFHWRMFQKLLHLKLAASPVLVYQGFAKLWSSSNAASLGLISLNIFVLALVDFRPHPVQLLVMGIVTLPGVVGLLWPTLSLYRVLGHKKTRRVGELLDAAHNVFRAMNGAQRVLAYSSVYSSLYTEKSVGNMQAVLSFILASVSLVIACLQVFGWDGLLREALLHK